MSIQLIKVIIFRYSHTITLLRCSGSDDASLYCRASHSISLPDKTRKCGVRFISFSNFVVRKFYETHVVHANYCRLGLVAMWILCACYAMCTAVISVPRAGQKMSKAPRDSTSRFRLCLSNTLTTVVIIFTEGIKDKRKNKKKLIVKTRNKTSSPLSAGKKEIQTILRRSTIIRRRRFRVEGQPHVHTDSDVRGFYFS